MDVVADAGGEGSGVVAAFVVVVGNIIVVDDIVVIIEPLGVTPYVFDLRLVVSFLGTW